MNTIDFFVPCVPPTITSQQRRHKYKQDRLKQATAFWQAVMEKNAPPKPLKGALILEISITFKHTKKSQKICEDLGVAAIPRLTTVDCDNINKLPQDAMAKCGYFENDSRIYDLRVLKWYGDFPGVNVILKVDEEWNMLK